MKILAFNLSTVATGALSDRLGLCQSALWGVFIAVLILFVRDKRQMARTAIWGLGLSIVGTSMAAYGAFSSLQSWTNPVVADFSAGLLLLAAGIVEMYRHELLKYEPASHARVSAVFKWFRRSTLPLFALGVSILQPPCTSGTYSLLSEALSARPGQFIEAYLLFYIGMLFLPFAILFLVWYGLLCIPGVEHFKSRHRLAIRLIVGASTTIIGVLLLWKTHSITLLPGLANISP